ncbi:hypothetical protein [Lysobacter silvisoli]|uniref:hypothetical protein n=1 Tax=Lysobacter silvisoli TaxID=2293254 RepID=UPI0018C88D7F|nr:hypothetical protein [Lysobacter silvisoli]
MIHTQWKYLVSEIGPQLFGPSAKERVAEELSKRGTQGWELVTAHYDSAGMTTRLFFKQPA